MRDAVTHTERASAHRQRTQAIRHALEKFVSECLQVKLKRLGPDQREKREALVEAHQEYLKSDGIHMTPEGSQAIQTAWAQVATTLLR